MDGQILLFIQEWIRNDFLTPLMVAVTKLGDSGFIWIALSMVLLLFKKTRKAGWIAFLSIAFCFLINNLILKNAVARTRPYEVVEGLELLTARADDFSFPSGHACSSFAAASSYYRVLPRKAGVAAMILAVWIAFSRLYVGIHYPTDVLCGALIGIFGSLLVFKIWQWIEKMRALIKKRGV